MRHLLQLTMIGLTLLQGAEAVAAPGEPAVYADRAGAIRGYDPIAYFIDAEPVKGNRQFTYRWQDADWLFASAEHRDRFIENPQTYAPQYGGYCAYAMSKGSYASVDPEAWTIVDGKLYLNYSKSVRKKWLKNTDVYIERADNNWQRLRQGD